MVVEIEGEETHPASTYQHLFNSIYGPGFCRNKTRLYMLAKRQDADCWKFQVHMRSRRKKTRVELWSESSANSSSNGYNGCTFCFDRCTKWKSNGKPKIAFRMGFGKWVLHRTRGESQRCELEWSKLIRSESRCC